MDIEKVRIYCLSKQGAEETMPFGPDALVMKVNGKVFAILPLASERVRINLKCDPNYAIELRDENTDIIPGFHMNKKHWNTLLLDGNLREAFVKKLIDHSYDLIFSKNSKKAKT